MSYTYQNLTITKLSIVGAGQIGPDICLHFAKVFAGKQVSLVLLDIEEQALENARKKIEKKVGKGVESGAFKPEKAEAITSSINYTTDYRQLAGSDIVLEAATENVMVKDKIFRQAEAICHEDCLFFSNSSHMQPEVIFENIRDQGRCLVIHFFYPAERNPVVEIIPGENTDPAIVDTLLGFYEAIGKVPIRVKSSYGYAIDPIFEGICQTAILCLEKDYGSVKEIDKVAVSALDLGVGPFTALTLTGGNPITNHGLDEMNQLLIPWFRSPDALQKAVDQNIPWEIAQRGEEVEVPAEKAEKLTREFQGAYFALAAYIMDLGICNLNDLNMATEIALVIKPPFSLMNRVGIQKANDLVKEFCAEHPTFPFPPSLDLALENGGWQLSDIVEKTIDKVAVLTIRRPKVLNALNLSVLQSLKKAMQRAVEDPGIQGIVITGFGTKAFVSGADLHMLSSLKTPDEGYHNSHEFQAVLNDIEHYPKPVVCALNGFAFGGGNELALACTARIAKKGLPVVACQPEVNLGFIPGAGGTQRLPRLIGLDKAAEILRTARMVSGKEAAEIGLIDREAEGDLVGEAIQLVHQIANGEIRMQAIPIEPVAENGEAKALDIGHHSKKIDQILTRAIYEGARLSLSEGLDLESRLFGECIETDDMKIGLETFRTQGPKAKPAFVHH